MWQNNNTMNVSSPSSRCVKWPSTVDMNIHERWVLGCSYSLCSLFSMSGNLLVVIAILTTRQLRTQSNLLVVNLCVADLLVGGLAGPLSAYVLWYDINDDANCSFDMAVGFVIAFCCSASILLLVLLCIDRYLRIVHFNKYKLWMMRGRRIAAAVAIFWIIAATLAALFVADINTRFMDLIMVGTAAFSFVMMVCLYSLIFRTVAKQSKAVKSHGMAGPQSSCAEGRADRPGVERKKTSQTNPGISFHMHLAKSFFIINVTFFLCWAPFLSILVLRREMYRNGKDVNTSVYHWCLLIGYLNSTLNPIIYNARNRGIRARIKGMFRRNGNQ
eukprot:gene17299-19031_t